MGCDIHMVVEMRQYRDEPDIEEAANPAIEAAQRLTGDRPWMVICHEYGSYKSRNYNVFARLAGVRADSSDPEPISEPRGLPPDVSSTAAKALPDESDFHSHSWVTLQEVRDYPHWGDGCTGFLEWLKTMSAVAHWEHRAEDIRFVFAFDS